VKCPGVPPLAALLAAWPHAENLLRLHGMDVEEARTRLGARR